MKTIEINGQKVLAVNVPKDAEGFYVVENWLQWNHSDKSKPDFEFLPIEGYTIIADSSDPKKFVKVWYPDAKAECYPIEMRNDYYITNKGRVISPGYPFESVVWEDARDLTMQEHGLEGRVILLTEKIETA